MGAAKFKEWVSSQPARTAPTSRSADHRRPFLLTSGPPASPSLAVNNRTFYQREGAFAVDAASTRGGESCSPGRVRRVWHLGAGQGPRRVCRRGREGKIVLALKGSPTTAPTPRVQFAPPPAPEAPRPAGAKDEWAEENDRQAKVMTAYAKGAAGRDALQPGPAPAAGMFVMGGIGGRGEPIDPAAFTARFCTCRTSTTAYSAGSCGATRRSRSEGSPARFAGMRADIKARRCDRQPPA